MQKNSSIQVLSIFLLFIFLISCKKDVVEPKVTVEPKEKELSFEEKLQAIPGILIEELPPVNGYKKVYKILVTQPIDHNHPSGPTFAQEVYLRHQDESFPVIYDTRGYGLNEQSNSAMTDLFPANYLGVEHRYFAESRPEPVDWKYLNIKQAADDHHRIVDLFDDIYQGKWVNTGSSKGGMTALFHKRFYPDDVDATVAFVAPMLTGLPDIRFDKFLTSEVGNASCRQAIETFQQIVLSRRAAMLTFFSEYQATNKFSYSIGLEKVLELSTLEYQFSFWQYGWSSCELIPSNNATDQEVFEHLIQVSPAWYYDDVVVDFFLPFFYQAYTELGYYYFVDDHLHGLIIALDEPNHRDLAPDVSMTYDPSVMQDILQWLPMNGNNIIYIYGADDPYTATAAPEPTNTNSIRIIQAGTNHSVKFQDLDQKEVVFNALEDWLEVEIE